MCWASPWGAAPVFSFFASSAPPRWHNVFSQFAPVVNSAVYVFASGSNFAVKPTCLRQAAYFRSLAPKKTNLFSPCLFKRHSVSQALFSAGFVVFLGFACWRCVLQALRCLGGAALFHSSRPSPNSCYPFWLLALTFRSSRPAYGGRLTSPVRHLNSFSACMAIFPRLGAKNQAI